MKLFIFIAFLVSIALCQVRLEVHETNLELPYETLYDDDGYVKQMYQYEGITQTIPTSVDAVYTSYQTYYDVTVYGTQGSYAVMMVDYDDYFTHTWFYDYEGTEIGYYYLELDTDYSGAICSITGSETDIMIIQRDNTDEGGSLIATRVDQDGTEIEAPTVILEVTDVVGELTYIYGGSCITSGNYIYIAAHVELNAAPAARRNLESAYSGVFTVIDISDIDDIVYPTDLQGTEYIAQGQRSANSISFADFGNGKVVMNLTDDTGDVEGQFQFILFEDGAITEDEQFLITDSDYVGDVSSTYSAKIAAIPGTDMFSFVVHDEDDGSLYQYTIDISDMTEEVCGGKLDAYDLDGADAYRYHPDTVVWSETQALICWHNSGDYTYLEVCMEYNPSTCESIAEPWVLSVQLPCEECGIKLNIISDGEDYKLILTSLEYEGYYLFHASVPLTFESTPEEIESEDTIEEDDGEDDDDDADDDEDDDDEDSQSLLKFSLLGFLLASLLI